MKQYRNEWKYCCRETDLAILASRLDAALQKDEHGDGGGYRVNSLYFDDYKNSCARDNEAGQAKRFKYRIRYYNDQADALRLERKEKLYGRCRKESCPLDRAEYDAIMQGRWADVFWSTEKPLLQRFCAEAMARRFEPKVIVRYDRKAYVEPVTNVRVTLDMNISASAGTESFLCAEGVFHRLQPSGQHVLEVKFDNILPGYIKKLIQLKPLQQSAFSKYYNARKRMERI